jgi:hypothetical protein
MRCANFFSAKGREACHLKVDNTDTSTSFRDASERCPLALRGLCLCLPLTTLHLSDLHEVFKRTTDVRLQQLLFLTIPDRQYHTL